MNELKQYLKLNLQHFAEEDTQADERTQETDEESSEETDEDEMVTLSPAELQRKIESESDKKLDKALKKQREKFDAQVQAEVQKALQEDKRLSKLSEAERKEETLTKREQELQERERKIKESEVRSDAINELANRKIDTRFVDYLATDDADETFDKIKAFNELLDETINAAVKASTRQDPPTRGGYKLKGEGDDGKSVIEMAREKRIIK